MPAPEPVTGSYFNMVGRFSPYPEGYPPQPFSGLTEDDVEDLIQYYEFRKLEGAKLWSTKLDIPGYIEVCSQMHMTFADWVGLNTDQFYKKYGMPDLFKEALKLEARRINESIKKKREEEIADLKMKSQDVSKPSFNPESTGNYLNRVFR